MRVSRETIPTGAGLTRDLSVAYLMAHDFVAHPFVPPNEPGSDPGSLGGMKP
jgi:hypothetical protein